MWPHPIRRPSVPVKAILSHRPLLLSLPVTAEERPPQCKECYRLKYLNKVIMQPGCIVSVTVLDSCEKGGCFTFVPTDLGCVGSVLKHWLSLRCDLIFQMLSEELE